MSPTQQRSAWAHLDLARGVVAHPLPALVHLAHQHLARAEVEGAQVHGAAQVARQLGLAPELLPARAADTARSAEEGAGGEGQAGPVHPLPSTADAEAESRDGRPDLRKDGAQPWEPGWSFWNIPETESGRVLEKRPKDSRSITALWTCPGGAGL